MANPWQSDPKDVEMESLITRRIREKMGGVHVSVKGGHVTLSGTVDDFDTKREVLALVREIGGVREITNYIKVVPIGESEYD